jgi:acetoin utilization deacetylase AcuC-like enzyme
MLAPRRRFSTTVPRMPLYYSEKFTVPLSGAHGSFPMERYALAFDATVRALRLSAQASAVEIREPPAAADADLARVHERAYLESVFSAAGLPAREAQRVGLGAWSPAWAARTRAIAGATLAATRDALRASRGGAPDFRGPGGVACVAAGGTHHAFPAHGEGYCFVNDLAASAAWALAHGAALGVRCVGVLDVDVHQGNGTAACLAREPRAVTVSVHGAGNYPWSSRFPGSFDVDVPDGAGDAAYLDALEAALAALGGLAAAARADPAAHLAIQRVNRLAARRAGWGAAVLGDDDDDDARDGKTCAHQDAFRRALAAAPDAPAAAAQDTARRWWGAARPSDAATAQRPLDLLLLQMGVDALENDRLGRLKVTRGGLQRRNARIFQWAEEHSCPIVVTMGGGYGRDLQASAEAHADVFSAAAESHSRRARLYQEIR